MKGILVVLGLASIVILGPIAVKGMFQVKSTYDLTGCAYGEDENSCTSLYQKPGVLELNTSGTKVCLVESIRDQKACVDIQLFRNALMVTQELTRNEADNWVEGLTAR